MRLPDGHARSIVHGDVLHGCERLRPGDADVAHVADVEDTDAGTDSQVLLDHTARRMDTRPACPSR